MHDLVDYSKTSMATDIPGHNAKLLRDLQRYLGDGGASSFHGNEHLQSLADLLDDNYAGLLNPSPFHGKSRNSSDRYLYLRYKYQYSDCWSDRQAIQTGKVSKYPDLPPLTEEQKLGIFSISDMYDLNEINCLDYWIAASDESNRRWLEADLGHVQSFFENRLVNTIVTMFEHDRLCLLEAVGLVFKSRHDLSLSSAKKTVITKFTNRLLKAGIITNIIQGIKVGLVEKLSFRSIDFIQECLLLLADDYFICTYLVQLTVHEYEELVSAIQSISEILSVSRVPEKNDWKLNSVLVVLQVSQISVLEQRETLYDRQESNLSATSESKNEGNTLYQIARSKDGLEGLKTGCKGVKGVSCLAHAVLRQPMVDAERADITDVIWFMQEAYQLRAYSYLRLCIVPSLQSRGVGNGDIQPLLCGVISQLLMVRDARWLPHFFVNFA